MMFWLGTHMPNWLGQTDAPLFVSRRRLSKRQTLPRATGTWALDSGGFTELSMYGHWRTLPFDYAEEVWWFAEAIGGLEWVAPQDWMCEPHILEKTGRTVAVHHQLTVDNFLELRNELGMLVIPVLQGWELDDYHRCWEMYEAAGVNLEDEPLVGVGSVCRRQNMAEAGRIIRSLLPLRLHAFGVKLTGIRSFGDALVSADSMAWSYQARMDNPLPGCTHKSCANCLRYALRWHEQVRHLIGQQRLEVA